MFDLLCGGVSIQFNSIQFIFKFDPFPLHSKYEHGFILLVEGAQLNLSVVCTQGVRGQMGPVLSSGHVCGAVECKCQSNLPHFLLCCLQSGQLYGWSHQVCHVDQTGAGGGGGELIVDIEQSFNEMHQLAPAKATSLCSSSFGFNLPQEQCNQHACL